MLLKAFSACLKSEAEHIGKVYLKNFLKKWKPRDELYWYNGLNLNDEGVKRLR